MISRASTVPSGSVLDDESGLSAAVLLPRVAGLMRLMLWVRCGLAVLALALVPLDQHSLSNTVAFLGFALLSALVAWRWHRLAPVLHRRPLLVSVDILAAATILLLAGPTGAFFIATALTSVLAGVLFAPLALVLVVTLQLVAYLAVLVATAGQEPLSGQLLVIHLALYPVLGMVGRRLGTILTELASAQAEREAAQRAAAASEERARLAREMHDSVAKTLRGAEMAAQALPMWVERDPERALHTAEQVAEAAQAASGEARELITELRSQPAAEPAGPAAETGPVHEDAAGPAPTGPLATAVRAQVADWAAEQDLAATTFIPDEAVEVVPTARLELLAILGEALTNVSRHASASAVQVALTLDGGSVVLRVTDDGRGFYSPPTEAAASKSTANAGIPNHYGLVGMHERAYRVGATLIVDSTPDGGTRLVGRFPRQSGTTR